MADFGVPTAGQLEKINALAKRTLSADEVFSFPTKMVGDALLKERLVQLSKPLLEVFRDNAKSGIAFMLDHPWAGFNRPKPAYPYGRTYDAILKRSDGTLEGENWALFGDTYIVRGKEKDGVSTDGIIADIEDGTLFDVSVGFGFNTSICSICGNEYYSGKCEHWRGQLYDDKLCYIIGKPPGWLGELSGVWDGAYPTAGVLSKDGSSEGPKPFILIDDMPREDLKKVPSDITTYGFYSAVRGDSVTYFKKDDLAKGNTFTVPDLSSLKGSDNKVSEKYSIVIGSLDATKFVTEITQDAAGAKISLSESMLSEIPAVKTLLDKAVADALANAPKPEEPAEAYMTQAQAVEKLGKELPADKVLSCAKDGMAYRAELVEEALKSGVRAQADAFKKETWERNFELMSVQDIKDTMDTWQKQAKDEIPAGRTSSAGANQGAVTQSELPDEAFQA